MKQKQHRIKLFFRALFFADFFKKMFDQKDDSVMPEHFIAIFAAITVIFGGLILVGYCAYKNQAMPGGSSEFLLGTLLIAVLRQGFSGYTEMKTTINRDNNDKEEEKTNN